MSPLADIELLRHIEEALEKILRHTNGKTFEQIYNDENLYDAIIRRFEIMGEASTKISQITREKYSELPWREMIGMRNRLIHNYFDVDGEILWHTITNSLPDLQVKLKLVLSKESNLF
jgi:uncharacterized protein with HEPN domain